MSHHTAGGILYRDHAKLRRTGFYLAKNIINSRQGKRLRGMAEMLERSLLSKSAFRPQISNRDRLLESQARRHDLAEQTGELFVVERPLIARHRPTQYLSFTLRAIKHGDLVGTKVALDLRDPLSTFSTCTDQIADLCINAVDLVKKGAEALGGKGGGGRPDMAQAGGPDGAKADAALAAIEAALGG